MARKAKDLVLALGGGGTRGFAHVGVLEVLEQHNIKPSGIVGVSAGAVAGAGYCLGRTSVEMRQRVLEFASSRLARDPHLRSLADRVDEDRPSGLVDKVGRLLSQGRLVKSFLMDGSIMSGDYFQRLVEFFLPEARIEDLPIPFACLATDVLTGEPVVFDRGPLREAVLASSSVPGVAPPLKMDGRWLIDGGVSYLVPTRTCRRLFPRARVMAINVDREVKTQALPGQALESYLRAGEIQAYHLNKVLLDEADLVLTPDVGEVHWADSARAAWLMDQGHACTEEHLGQIQALLAPQPWWKGLFSNNACHENKSIV